MSLARLGETDRGEEIVDDARPVVVRGWRRGGGGGGQAGVEVRRGRRAGRDLCLASSAWLEIGTGSSGLGADTRPTFPTYITTVILTRSREYFNALP